MRNWDPLSLFKYLTGHPTMHIVMLISYHQTPKYTGSDSVGVTDEQERLKSSLIPTMEFSHFACAFLHLVFEMGLLEAFCGMAPSIVIPSVSLFMQILFYQGLIF